MSNPEIFYKVRIQKEGGLDSFEYVTREQAETRGLLRQVLSGNAAQYVNVGPGNWMLLRDWERQQRGQGGKK
ncbi:MAG: hypothetical protein PHW10_04410 [Candidatus Peribacteraceae bacterium]|nr:hypothetical protein [Candidatus Peribacteraceae bacterium]